jgi:hypothetical protein
LVLLLGFTVATLYSFPADDFFFVVCWQAEYPDTLVSFDFQATQSFLSFQKYESLLSLGESGGKQLMRTTKAAQLLLPSLMAHLKGETSTFAATEAEAVFMGVQSAKAFSEYGRYSLAHGIGDAKNEANNSFKGAFDMFALCCDKSTALKGRSDERQLSCSPPGSHTGGPVNVVALSHIRYALFCDDCLRRFYERKDDGLAHPCEWDDSITVESLAGIIARNLLSGMRTLAGSSYSSSQGANDRFPRLLSLLSTFCSSSSDDKVGKYVAQLGQDKDAARSSSHASGKAKKKNAGGGDDFTLVEQEFLKGCLDDSMPSWLFLRWTNQLMATLSRPEGGVLVRVLERMAQKYSRALYYPLNLSVKSLPASERGKLDGTIGRLRALVHDGGGQVMGKLVETLGGLHNPDIKWTELLGGIQKMIKVQKKTKQTKWKADLKEGMLDCISTSKPQTGDSIGRNNRAWIKQNKSSIEKAFGADGAKATEANIAAEKARCGKTNYPYKSSVLLSDLSEWMAEFDAIGQDGILELPGQYDQYVCNAPQADMHTHVLSFSPQVAVMTSKQKPKRLKVIGSDEREHNFLVKGGDDLRGDQRVQQLFTTINKLLQADSQCLQRRLRNKTFKVIPMLPNLGMVEWVDNTVTFQEVLEGEAGSKVDKSEGSIAQKAWINAQPGPFKGHNPNNYWKAALAKESEVRSQYEMWKNGFDSTCLRKRLVRMAATPEAFLCLRSEFGKTLSTFSISSYILGIGDRHLQNFLVDKSDGTLVGIDFGLTFGSGASYLPVPELIPFRLSPQFTSLLSPLDTVSLLKQDMVHVLSTLRQNENVISNIMEVYVNEPLVEWTQGITKATDNFKIDLLDSASGEASSQMSTQPSTSRSSSSQATQNSASQQPGLEWEAKVKVDRARRKLRGYCPRKILAADLNDNSSLARVCMLCLYNSRVLFSILWIGDHGEGRGVGTDAGKPRHLLGRGGEKGAGHFFRFSTYHKCINFG